jgi:hypothetical protein
LRNWISWKKIDSEHDDKIVLLFENLRQLEQARQHKLNQQNRNRVGLKEKMLNYLKYGGLCFT